MKSVSTASNERFPVS